MFWVLILKTGVFSHMFKAEVSQGKIHVKKIDKNIWYRHIVMYGKLLFSLILTKQPKGFSIALKQLITEIS